MIRYGKQKFTHGAIKGICPEFAKNQMEQKHCCLNEKNQAVPKSTNCWQELLLQPF
jgi:hypothetical protein